MILRLSVNGAIVEYMGTKKRITDEELIEILSKRLPSLLKKHPDILERIRKWIDGRYVRKDEIKLILKEMREERKAMIKQLEVLRKDVNSRFERLVVDMNKRFEAVDRRFEEINKRFEAVDRRFEQLVTDMNKRFEAVDRRFEQLVTDMNKRFEAVDRRFEQLVADMNKRFEAVDRRFEQLVTDMNKRFEAVDHRFEEMRDDFHKAVSSVGSRWGEDAEFVFREGLKKVLSQYYSGEVREMWIDDEEGLVKGYPARYQVDALVTDSITILIEVKSQADDFDVLKLHRLGKIYEKKYGVKPKLILLAVLARESARREAEELKDVEIVTHPREYKP